MGYYYHVYLNIPLGLARFMPSPYSEQLPQVERLLKYLCSDEKREHKRLPDHPFFRVEGWQTVLCSYTYARYENGDLQVIADLLAWRHLDLLPLFLDWVAPYVLVVEAYKFIGSSIGEQDTFPHLYFVDDQHHLVKIQATDYDNMNQARKGIS